jgi:hypothetical protein
LIDARAIRHVQTLDFILIGEGLRIAQHILLFRSVELNCSTANEYKDAILTMPGELICRHIRIRPVAGDGFSSQLRAVGRTSEFSIQNDRSLRAKYRWVRSVFSVRCRCHLCNSAEEDWAAPSLFMAGCRRTLHEIAPALRKRETRNLVKDGSPSVYNTRFCHGYLIIRWISKHREVLPPQFPVGDGIFAYGM